MLQEEFLEKYDLVDPGLTKYYSIQYNFHHHHIVATTVIHMIFFKVRLSNSESPRTIFALLVCIFKFSSLLKVWRDICRDNVEIMFVCLLCRWKGKLLFVICKLKMFLADQEVVDHPTQLICIWIFIGCQQTNTQDIGQFEDQEVETY